MGGERDEDAEGGGGADLADLEVPELLRDSLNAVLNLSGYKVGGPAAPPRRVLLPPALRRAPPCRALPRARCTLTRVLFTPAPRLISPHLVSSRLISPHLA